jgi:tetratricopeptide (TPR) repeat protein
VTGFVAHPRQRPAQERALALLTTRLEKSVTRNPDFGPAAGGRTFMYGGQLSAAITATLKLDACPELEIYWAYMFGKSQLPEAADAALRSRAPASAGCAMGPFIAGAYAADQARWAKLEDVRASLIASADSAWSAGDTTKANGPRLQAEALRAYALARAGKLDAAIQVLEEIQPRLPMNTNKIVRWWLGNLLFQANRPLEARRYFESFWDWQHGHPIAASYYLGRIDEQLGQRADARARYTRFASAWRNADREIQPRVADARARIAVLARIPQLSGTQ